MGAKAIGVVRMRIFVYLWSEDEDSGWVEISWKELGTLISSEVGETVYYKRLTLEEMEKMFPGIREEFEEEYGINMVNADIIFMAIHEHETYGKWGQIVALFF